MEEWYSPAELAKMALPGLPATRENITRKADDENWRKPGQEYPQNPKGVWRKRSGAGGGYEYRYDALPMPARTKLICDLQADAAVIRTEPRDAVAVDLWRWFDGLPLKKKLAAERALRILQAIDIAEMSGIPTDQAIRMIVRDQKSRGERISDRTIYNWKSRVAGLSRSNWLPALAPRNVGRVTEMACDPAAWSALYVDYFRPEAPNFTSCYRRLESLAKEYGWTIPPSRTLQRRIDAVPEVIRVLSREGMEKLKKLYPAQIRDREPFHACEGVNVDGHTWDVFVQWPDGDIVRPVTVGFQDLYSGKILSYRHDRTENKETVLLAFGDLVTNYGIPSLCWLDNGRAFASKWLTGGTPNRYRFKVKDSDPCGVMTLLDIEIHWTLPYSGQSKPIERAWRDFAQEIAKHPKFAGAYVGNKVDAKPENYRSRAVPYDAFLQVVAEGIAEHNARKGRRSRVCAGKLSFDDVFNASYATSPVVRATQEQCRLWLLASESVKVRKNAQIAYAGNFYWNDALTDMIGDPVILRFDPDFLHDPIHVYRLDGAYVCEAECIEAVGFKDAKAARDHAQARKRWIKAVREMDEAERALTIDDLAAMLPSIEAAPTPSATVLRPARLRRVKAAPAPTEWNHADFGRGVAAMDNVTDMFAHKKSDAA